MKKEMLLTLCAGMALSVAGVALANTDENPFQSGKQQNTTAAVKENTKKMEGGCAAGKCAPGKCGGMTKKSDDTSSSKQTS